MWIMLDGSNVIRSYGNVPGDTTLNPSWTNHELTDAQWALISAEFALPNGGVTWDGTTATALPVPPPPPIADPLKPYRDALATAADNDPNLASTTKTALQNLLAAMAPQG